MAEHTIHIEWSITTRVRVDVPEGSTLAQIEAIREAAVAAAAPPCPDAERFDSLWARTPTPAPHGAVPAIRDDEWIVVDGVRWAACRWCACREGYPMPTRSPVERDLTWTLPDGADLRAYLSSAAAWDAPAGGLLFSAAFAEVLAGGEPREARRNARAVAVWRDGVVAAVVAGYLARSGDSAVDAWGQPAGSGAAMEAPRD